MFDSFLVYHTGLAQPGQSNCVTYSVSGVQISQPVPEGRSPIGRGVWFRPSPVQVRILSPPPTFMIMLAVRRGTERGA